MRVNGLECEERNRNDKAVKEQEIGWRVSGGGFFFLIFFYLEHCHLTELAQQTGRRPTCRPVGVANFTKKKKNLSFR